MVRRCGTCYLEIQSGDKACRRCGSPVEREGISWPMAFVALVSMAALAYLGLHFLRR